MTKVRTFSRVFPSYHPRAGEPTYFVEKIWESICMGERFHGVDQFYKLYDLGFDVMPDGKYEPKHHTIRAGHHFKPGDWFSPRVWSGVPYNSKQIIIAPAIQVKKVWDFKIEPDSGSPIKILKSSRDYCGLWYDVPADEIPFIANNDGLSFLDFMHWFQYPKPFDGQIICWNENVNY